MYDRDEALVLYFPHETFPIDDFRSMLNTFGSVTVEREERDPAKPIFSAWQETYCAYLKSIPKWEYSASALLMPLRERDRPHYAPDARWSVGLSAERAVESVWFVRVIAYHLLSLIRPCVLYRVADSWMVRDADEWHAYLSRFDLWSFTLIEMGFAAEDGRLLI